MIMGRGRAWNALARTKVIALHQIGTPVSQIVAQTQVSRSTVYEYITRSRQEGNSVPTVKQRDCPPRKVTLANIRTISVEIKKFPRTTARIIKAKHPSLGHLSVRTINKIIR